MVDEQGLKAIKQQLLARQQQLLGLIQPVAVKVEGKTVKSADQQAQLEWSQINKALVRIDAGTFGQCVVCGELIDNNRLQAYPHSPFCRGCVNP